ncbi:long-chain-acyl-CoA dehydrogenase [Rhodococcus sp. OK611]|jgi:alkylation response protein AidB-like acyl-CoA dehydrogenase|uniref:acyl-CoA dehydrogenase family protein n=1 Tax=unclassified Rhodococcus (in: high G+C Gram-positive bacteria) TaxID=192944 RepID=UPI000BCEE402|nr:MULTISPECIES: acyl-CoA dehydrogenase family protein [unclassified Rhodococcus (in: high G+C Gram-positive bacteria)]PTR35938.1 long-chain-acyl-CoA dehydrogenase [Rhodococcus sp. OK611]SNX94125.1 long-chain-acyl-CoA dehydrogenase [Rhodococcus sp. OK270]
MQRKHFESDHEDYRGTVREFLAREVEPRYLQWEEDRLIDRASYVAAGRSGIIGLGVPEEFGGSGVTDYRFRHVVSEEIARTGTTSFGSTLSLQDDITIPYILHLGTPAQKERWLPRMAAGELIGAIAMTEPGAGSDLQGVKTTAVRDGDEWVINGQKTFITNGIHSDLVIVVCRTDPNAGSKGFSLIVVERDTPGFSRGRKLHKVGLAAQDTAELVFENVRVPAENVLGTEGRGFIHLMENLPLERIGIAVGAITAARAAYEWTKSYAFERKAFGRPIGDLQNSRFVLAEMLTEIEVTESHIDRCVIALNAGDLTAVDASKAKWWATELQKRVVDRGVQLHGGYGFMMEYPIGRAYVDTRIQTIYGGTTEIMKEIIGRAIASEFR